MASIAKFDSKHFNPEAFKYLVERVPNLRRNEIIKSGALVSDPEVAATMKAQNGTAFARFVLKGTIEGGKVKYDGNTNIASRGSKTYSWGVQSFGWADGFIEKDFSFDVTGGQDFMSNVAAQISEYKDKVNTGYLYAILKGIFAMSGDFATKHTFDITDLTGNDSLGNPKNFVGATTLNDATQKACMQDKSKFKLVFMHSVPATNLENLRLIKYMQYTDKDGIQRDLALATWNGRSLIIDDSLPVSTVDAVYAASTDTTVDATKTYYTRSGSAGSYVYTAVATPTGNPSTSNYYERTAEAYDEYTTYVLGEGAFVYEDLGAKVPVEMDRDPATNGGEDVLYIRERKVLAPRYISFIDDDVVCPEEADFEDGSNWELVSDNAATKTFVDHKAIAIARIISRG